MVQAPWSRIENHVWCASFHSLAGQVGLWGFDWPVGPLINLAVQALSLPPVNQASSCPLMYPMAYQVVEDVSSLEKKVCDFCWQWPNMAHVL